MGGLVALYKFDREDPVIQFLSQINSRDIEEALSFYIDEYPHVLRVKFRHFDDIFGGMLNDVDNCFFFFSGGKIDVDLLEIFAVMIIACRGTISWKVRMLFCLFDFDNSENIDKNEISLVLSAFTKALSKLGTGFPPSTTKLFLIASSIFKDIDKDNSSTLELEEVLKWSEQNVEFQELMAHFSHIQSLELATIYYNEALKLFTDIEVPDTVTDQLRRKLSFTVFSRLSNEELETFFRNCMVERVLSPEKFLKFGELIIAFLISDFTQRKTIEKQEIQVLLSIISQEEKSILLVEDFMRKIRVPRNSCLTFAHYLEIIATNEELLGVKP